MTRTNTSKPSCDLQWTVVSTFNVLMAMRQETLCSGGSLFSCCTSLAFVSGCVFCIFHPSSACLLSIAGNLSLWQRSRLQAGFASWRHSRWVLSWHHQTCAAHHTLSGMEESNKKENVRSPAFLRTHRDIRAKSCLISERGAVCADQWRYCSLGARLQRAADISWNDNPYCPEQRYRPVWSGLLFRRGSTSER